MLMKGQDSHVSDEIDNKMIKLISQLHFITLNDEVEVVHKYKTVTEPLNLQMFLFVYRISFSKYVIL